MSNKSLPRIRAGFDRESEELVQITPAAPGFFALEFLYDDDEPTTEFTRTPIVAWGITPTGAALPITPYAENTMIDAPVQSPCGRVVCYDGLYDSAEQWFERMRPYAEQERAARTAKWSKPAAAPSDP